MSYPNNGPKSGRLVAGGNTNQLDIPIASFLDKLTDSLSIIVETRSTVVRCPIGVNNWTLIIGNSNGSARSSSTEFRLPSNVMLDPMGNIYVAYRNNHCLQFFLLAKSNGATIVGITNISGSNST